MFALVREHHIVLRCIGCGQQSDVAQVANARSAEVHLSETDDNRVAVMVARTPVPTALILRWPNLHQSVRHVCAQKHVSVSACTDVGVYVLGKVLRPCANPNREKSR